MQDWQTTSDWRLPVNIWSIIQLQWCELLVDGPFVPKLKIKMIMKIITIIIQSLNDWFNYLYNVYVKHLK